MYSVTLLLCYYCGLGHACVPDLQIISKDVCTCAMQVHDMYGIKKRMPRVGGHELDLHMLYLRRAAGQQPQVPFMLL